MFTLLDNQKNMMKYVLMALLLLIAGVITGYYMRSSAAPLPIIKAEYTAHMCGCIDSMPKYQYEVLDASSEVNILIRDKTEEFTKRNDLMLGDFDAAFIPSRNGDYSVKIWCSNRTENVARLLAEYEKLVKSCLHPHHQVMKKSHEEYHK